MSCSIQLHSNIATSVQGSIKKLYLQTTHEFAHEFAKYNALWTSAIDAPPAPVFQLSLRRSHLLEDAFRQLSAADDCAFGRQLLVNKSALLRVTTLMKASSPQIEAILSAVINEASSLQVVPDRVSEPLPD